MFFKDGELPEFHPVSKSFPLCHFPSSNWPTDRDFRAWPSHEGVVSVGRRAWVSSAGPGESSWGGYPNRLSY